jgi:hypothetical protein
MNEMDAHTIMNLSEDKDASRAPAQTTSLMTGLMCADRTAVGLDGIITLHICVNIDFKSTKPEVSWKKANLNESVVRPRDKHAQVRAVGEALRRTSVLTRINKENTKMTHTFTPRAYGITTCLKRRAMWALLTDENIFRKISNGDNTYSILQGW